MLAYCVIITLLFILSLPLSKKTSSLSQNDNRKELEENRKLISENAEYKTWMKYYKDENQKLKSENADLQCRWKTRIMEIEKDYKNKIEKEMNAFKKDTYKNYELFLREKSESYPYLINKIADFLCSEGFEDADFHISSSNNKKLERGLKLLDYTTKIKDLTKENLALKYQIEDLISLYPDIENDITFDNIVETQTEDTNYLSKEEWNTLSDTEKNQLILDRYIENNKKSNWEIGSLFELYIGSVIEARGHSVEYFGIEKKLEDLGRDLVVKTKNEIYIIQCKYWNKHKVIREKHLCQLFGTATSYMMEQPDNDRKKIIPVFVCHNELSETAKKMANYLGIKIYENVELRPFPMIKCNLDTFIYHLPVDDNYWTMMTEKTKGKFKKVMTVREAEELGCRRAFKHRP